jgi:hypothetical protein
MIKKSVGIITMGLLFVSLGLSQEALAAVKGNPDDLKIDTQSNEKAIAIVENQGSLEDSPVPAENLTTYNPSHTYDGKKALRAATSSPFQERIVFYRVNQVATNQSNTEIRNNYLVPVDFTWADNGIPLAATCGIQDHSRWPIGSTKVFYFNERNIIDTGVGGYGAGGYYWRQFKSYVNNQWMTYWLSTWNLNYLLSDPGDAGSMAF